MKRNEMKRKEKKRGGRKSRISKDTFLSTSLMMTIEEIHLEADATLMPLVIESVLPCFFEKDSEWLAMWCWRGGSKVHTFDI